MIQFLKNLCISPLTRSYGELHKRPEVQNSTVEFIASSDYMLPPPQPAVYSFVLDVSHNAVEAGYLTILCQSLLENLDKWNPSCLDFSGGPHPTGLHPQSLSHQNGA
ncbi:Protein transport protein Sec24B [Manis javanica]|nr:Protein transport protein Sec24B [Manis javanica]